MWPFKTRSRNAESAAFILMSLAKDTAPYLLGIVESEAKPVRDHPALTSLETELLFLALQVTDRIAFDRLGAKRRSTFMDSLLPILKRRLDPPIALEFTAMYNQRQEFYAQFSRLFPEENEGTKDTLFWEFGKLLQPAYAPGDPVACFAIARVAGGIFLDGILDAFTAGKLFE
jgi:hypothetical protein